MEYGIELKIDVSKIDKSKIYPGKKGKWLTLTTFIKPDEPGKYGDHGAIKHSQTKEEREQGINSEIIGNAKIFYTKGSPAEPQQTQRGPQGNGYVPPVDDDDSSIPF